VTAPFESGRNRVLAALFGTLHVSRVTRWSLSRTQRARVGCVVSLALLLSGSSIDGWQATTSSFAGMTVFSCAFSLMTTAAWNASEPRADVKPAVLSFQLKDVNTDEGSARFVDATTDVPVVSRLSGSNLYFLDIRPEGTFATVTLFDDRGAPKLRAVYTRTHYYRFVSRDFVAVPTVEQYYGFCEPAP
jgi:hypothetical protein